jgi:hypothetical protein
MSDEQAENQLREQERVQQFLEPRLRRAERAYAQAVKSLWLGNAGAAVASLSFLGATWRSGSPPRMILLSFALFVCGLIALGTGELITLIIEARRIGRIQTIQSPLEMYWDDIESPVESIGLHFSPRTILALISGACFVLGVIVGSLTIYFSF